MFNLVKLSSRSFLAASCVLISSLWFTANSAVADDATADKIKVLIVDGQNNHEDWPKITAVLKQYLESTGKFTVDVERTKFTWKGNSWLPEFSLDDGKEYKSGKKAVADPDFKPDFSKYDVVVNNFGSGAAAWPEETQTAFTKFIADGGGMVSVHAADNCFPKWREYNEMIGLGGWGKRNEDSGPYVYLNDEGETIRDDSPGKGGDHGPRREFQLVVRDSEHPIMKGLPKAFMHSKDELYQKLRGPGENMTILATAFASPSKKGTGRHEPMLMAIDYEKGRIFHSTLGHAVYSCEGVGFITTFLRGTEWAATGEVTIEIPDDFPTAKKSVSRTFEMKDAAAGSTTKEAESMKKEKAESMKKEKAESMEKKAEPAMVP